MGFQDADESSANLFEPMLLLGFAAAGFSHSLSQAIVGEQGGEARFERRHIAVVHEKAGFSVGDDFGRARDAMNQDQRFGREGLPAQVGVETGVEHEQQVGGVVRARQALDDGYLVCIFAEGQITRIGHLLPFRRGFERIMKEVEAPIIPVALDGVWGIAADNGLPDPSATRARAATIA